MKTINDPEARRAALTVVNNAKCNFPRREKPADDYGFILPPINVFLNDGRWALECSLMGMTSFQRNMVWRIACGGERAKHERYLHATDRVFRIWNALEAALEQERREALAIMLVHYPAAARRIMRDLQRKPKGKAAK